jgi:transcriptional regulator GlxA family with amidase domain
LDALAAECGLSRRQFERRFLVEVGVSPGLLAGVARFRKLFDALEQETLRVRHWAEAAHAAGYFDQAHMNRDFKRFAGLPPQAFCKTLGGLSAAMLGANAP